MGNIFDCCTDPNAAPVYEQAAGHGGGSIVYVGDRLTKITRNDEGENYEKIFNDDEVTSLTKLRPFVPKFYGMERL